MSDTTNPDIGVLTGAPAIDSLLHRLLDAQQDINFAANTAMNQSLSDASALIDEVETALRRLARMQLALEKIAGSHPERVGYCQTDIDEAPDLTAGEALNIARAALSPQGVDHD